MGVLSDEESTAFLRQRSQQSDDAVPLAAVGRRHEGRGYAASVSPSLQWVRLGSRSSRARQSEVVLHRFNAGLWE